jgi:long-chain fatty acid transport protein
MMSTFGYEYFRIIGFPAIVEHHVTVGAGVQLTENFTLNLGYVRGLENTLTETSAGGAVTLESTLSEDFFEFGFAWQF